jgi:hypothetical protein
MPRKTRADDYVEELNAPVLGGASTVGESRLADALLETTLNLHRLSILLAEASADDWRELKPRITSMRLAFKAVPARAPKRRPVGFGPR